MSALAMYSIPPEEEKERDEQAVRHEEYLKLKEQEATDE